MAAAHDLRVCVLASGGGTTAEAILNATLGKGNERLHDVRVGLVIADTPEAGVLKRMCNAGMKTDDVLVFPPSQSKNKKREDEITDFILYECEKRRINFIGQYGFLPKTPDGVVRCFQDMMVNQHPGPLDPAAPLGFDFGGKGMYGRRVMQARLNFVRRVGRDSWTMAVAHRVTEEFDRGEVLGERRVTIFPDTDMEDLKARMLKAEHALQIDVLRQFAQGTVRAVEHDEYWLVGSHERALLDECKRLAIAEYPHG